MFCELDSNDGRVLALVKARRESVPSPKVCDGKLERRGRNSNPAHTTKNPIYLGFFATCANRRHVL
jgi:hypothetical protein